MTEIEWRSVVDFEGIYSVSSSGDVRRDGRATGAKIGRILRPGTNKPGGYHFVFLYVHCKSIRRYVHRIVAEAFHGSCPSGHEVNHKNGDTLDNRAENLEWVTKSENGRHAARVLRRGAIQYAGAKNCQAKTYRFYPPGGLPFVATGLNAVCKKYGLNSADMTNVVKGRQRHSHGWRCEYVAACA